MTTETDGATTSADPHDRWSLDQTMQAAAASSGSATPTLPPPPPARDHSRRWSGIALTITVVAAAYFATRLHRLGHTVGDDFALYLRQARSLFDGNVAQVIADNRLLWANSSLVTPPIYPWGFPLLLSPFVRIWGLDYEKLKLIEVACFCVWLVLFHGIVRRRAGRLIAGALTALFATAIPYLSHTDQLLTELPHLLAVAVVIWWLDRLIASGSVISASTGRLIVLGLLAVAAYNVRREGIVVLAVIGVAQLIDLRATASDRWGRGDSVRQTVRALPWKSIGLPYLTFVVGTVLFQLMLPSTLLPDNGNDRKWIGMRVLGLGDSRRDRSFPRELMLQLGLGRSAPDDAAWVARYGLGLLAIAAVGAVLACIWKPRWNLPLVALVLATFMIIGTHPRWVGRYYLQVTPFIAYFALMAPYAGYRLLTRNRRSHPAWLPRLAVTAVALPALWVTAVHVWVLPARMDAVAVRNEAGAQAGPVHRTNIPVYDAVLEHTTPDDIVIYYRARTMTLYTDRRSVQVQSVAKAERIGDYFMVNRLASYSQPKPEELDPALLTARGWVPVWQDSVWTLWKLPESDGIAEIRTDTIFDPVVEPTAD